ncbi:MAG: hypothetical protein KY475_26555 [Planctomycetes bacterium]|nr:hypothetical protein [Planctomycetota bacterium]
MKPSKWSMIGGIVLAALLANPAPSQDAQEGEQASPAADAAAPADKKQEAKDSADDKNADEKKSKAALKLQIFVLEHAKPAEMMQLLQMPMYGGGFAGQRYGSGYPATLGYRAQETPGAQPLRIAADEEKRILFVRGPAEQLDEVARVIKAFDAPADQMSQGEQVEGRFVIPLRHADAQRVTGILQQLQFPSQTLHVGGVTVLAVNAEGEELQQIQEVIAKLDAAPAESEDSGEAGEEAAEPEQSSTPAQESTETTEEADPTE